MTKSISKIGDEQFFYPQFCRHPEEEEAMAMIVNGFIEPFTKELPMVVRRRADWYAGCSFAPLFLGA